MKNLKLSSLLVACSILLVSAQSHATPPRLYTCTTVSYGKVFTSTGVNLSSEENRVIDECLDSAPVNIGQCYGNLFCDDTKMEDDKVVTCSTTSNGLTFVDAATNIEIAKNYAKILCISNPNTNPDECSENVKCAL
jgi:hypothetical protein